VKGGQKGAVEVEIPEGVEVSLEGSQVKVRGPKGELTRVMSYPGISFQQRGTKLFISSEGRRKREMAMIGTFAAHVRNMIKGVTQGFEYRLKVVHSHFPITVRKEGREILIDNFLGEKTPRRSRIFGDVEVSIKGNSIVVTGINLEEVAQTAANIELATRVSRRDRRVFQDGVYIVSKGVASG